VEVVRRAEGQAVFQLHAVGIRSTSTMSDNRVARPLAAFGDVTIAAVLGSFGDALVTV